MDRFSWGDSNLANGEQLLIVQKGVKLYNGSEKTAFDRGRVSLTTHRLLWTDNAKQTSVLCLPLSYSILLEMESGGFTRSAKIIMHLSSKEADSPPGPLSYSSFSFIQLSFTDGGQEEFFKKLNEAVTDRKWEKSPPKQVGHAVKSTHSGIAGIERGLQMRRQDRDATISEAFEDLSNLIKKAKDMVSLSKNISTKLRQKQGEISEDETIQFKSYLMSLGISDPITRESYGTGTSYCEGLAKETAQFLEGPLRDCGGVMSLTDAYCRINRARGIELLSPEDLEQACRLLGKLNMPVRLKEYDNGVKVLQLHSCDEEVVAEETKNIITEEGHLSAEELARLIGLSIVLAKQRLLVAESLGKLCRDESPEGLTFYPNLFKSND